MANDVIVYLLVMLSLSTANRCKRSIDSTHGTRLNNHVIDDSVQSNQVDCIQRCMKKRNCYSMNYHMSDKLCELNNGNQLLFGDDLVRDDWFIHMGNPKKILDTEKHSCMEIKMYNASAKSGNYNIKVGDQSMMVYCDMMNHGGGWTLVVSISKTNHDHLQTKEHNCFNSSFCVPDTASVTATRKLSDRDIHQILGTYEGTFRLQSFSTSIGFVFFQIPSGADKFNSSCHGYDCPRIIASHDYPYQWLSNCKGIETGYAVALDHYAFDTYDNSECGTRWTMPKSDPWGPYRGLYGTKKFKNDGGVYQNLNAKLFVR